MCSTTKEGVAITETASALVCVGVPPFDSLPVSCTISRRLTSRNNARTTSEASNPPCLLSTDLRVHARGRRIIVTRFGAPKDVRLCRSCTKFPRRQVVSSQLDRIQTSRSPQPCDKNLLALRRQEVQELTESCSPHEAVFAKLDGWIGYCPGRAYIID